MGPGTTRGFERCSDAVEPIVDLAPGAEHEPLAVTLAEAVRDGLGDPERRRAFERLRGAVGVVIDDAATALTLRFDFGRLTVHEGLVGVPTVTLRGPRAELEGLTRLVLVPSGVPDVTSRGGWRGLRRVARVLWARKLVIYGLFAHPRFVLRLLHVLSGEAVFDAGDREG